MPEAARLPPTLVGLVVIGATMVLCLPRPAVAAALFCPRGEITLSSDVLRIARSRGRDRVVSLGSSFVVPEGSAIDPVAEPVAFSLEADHRVLETIELPAGALEPRIRGNTFVFTQREPGGAIGRHSFVSVGKLRDAYRLRVRLTSLDLADLDLGDPPQRVKQLLKIGDDCFSSLLLCSAQDSSLICKPERNAVLRGRVQTGPHRRLAGAMLTAFDDARLESVSVFSQADGRYVFPRLRPGSYRLRARLVGYEDVVREGVTLAPGEPATEVFKLTPAADTNSQLPASHWFSLLLDDWPNPTIRGDFTLSCGNCHQIGAYRFRRDKTEEEWTEVVTRMMTFLPPYFQETRDLMLPTLLDAFGPEAPIPALPLPEPPSGDVLRAVIYEYGLGDESFRPGCHDLELGLDNVVYADAGVRWIDPRSGERGTFPIIGGAHSIERAPDGNMWITQAGEDVLARMDVHTGEFTYYPLPRIGDDQGSYPHTLRSTRRGASGSRSRSRITSRSSIRRPSSSATSTCRPRTRPRPACRSRSPTAATRPPTTPSGTRSSSASASATSTPRRGPSRTSGRRSTARAGCTPTATGSSGSPATPAVCSGDSTRRSSAGRSTRCRPASRALQGWERRKRRTRSMRTA